MYSREVMIVSASTESGYSDCSVFLTDATVILMVGLRGTDTM